jgi:hypothetical protein
LSDIVCAECGKYGEGIDQCLCSSIPQAYFCCTCKGNVLECACYGIVCAVCHTKPCKCIIHDAEAMLVKRMKVAGPYLNRGISIMAMNPSFDDIEESPVSLWVTIKQKFNEIIEVIRT